MTKDLEFVIIHIERKRRTPKGEGEKKMKREKRFDMKIRITKKGIKATLYNYLGNGMWDKVEEHYYKSIDGVEAWAKHIMKLPCWKY